MRRAAGARARRVRELARRRTLAPDPSTGGALNGRLRLLPDHHRVRLPLFRARPSAEEAAAPAAAAARRPEGRGRDRHRRRAVRRDPRGARRRGARPHRARARRPHRAAGGRRHHDPGGAGRARGAGGARLDTDGSNPRHVTPATLSQPVGDRRKYLILMGAIVAALVGALLIAIPGSPVYKKPVLGLDLQGGLEVVLKAVPPKGHQLTPDDLNRSISIMQNRINKLGVSEPEIRKQGKDQIVIQLAGVHDPAAAAALIGKTAQLMLFDFEADVTGPSKVGGNVVATPSLYELLKQVQTRAAKGEPEAFYLFHVKTTTTKPAKKGGKPKQTVVYYVDRRSPATTLKELLKPFGGKAPKDTVVMKVPAHTLVVRCPATSGCLGATTGSK